MNEEVWLPVAEAGFEHYEVSNRGRVRRGDTGHVMRLHPKANGYLQVGLSCSRKRKYFTAHRLVAKAFHGEPLEGEQVNHINGDKTDNRPENLEWVTQAQNMVHAHKTGLRRFSCPTDEQIVVGYGLREGMGWSYKRIAKHLDCGSSTLRNILGGDFRAGCLDRLGLKPIPTNRLSESDIAEIFELRAAGLLQREIAEKFGCTQNNVSKILAGKKRKQLNQAAAA